MPSSSRPAVRLLVASTALLATTAVTGCGGGDGDGGSAAPSASPTPSSSSPAAVPTTSAPGVTVSPSTAPFSDTRRLINAAKRVLDRVPDSTLTSIGDDDRGWEVTVATSDGAEQEAVVGPAALRILSGPTAQGGDRGDRRANARRVRGATVDYAVAARLVAGSGAGRVTDLTLDDYRGQVVWEGDAGNVSVRVNAGDGRVLTTGTGD